VACAGNNNWPTKNNAAYWDDCTLRRVDGLDLPAEQTPVPTFTPVATYTPVPTFTPPPTYTPEPTFTPLPGCTPCPEQAPCPTCVPGSSSDCPGLDEIQAAVATAVADRPPVVWPR
jgi:hypothetical protein